MTETGSLLPGGMEFWVEEGKLKYKAPKGTLTPAALEMLKANKELLLSRVQQAAPARCTLYPVSHNQQALHFLARLRPEAVSYNVGLACRILARVDIKALQLAVCNLTARHWPLRTVFITLTAKTSQLCQLCPEQLSDCFEEADLSNLDEEQIRQQVMTRYQIPFNLEKGPLFKVYLFKTSPTQAILLLNIHHIICDALSVKLLLEELAEFYQAAVDARVPELQTADYDYSLYIRDQQALLESPQGKAQAAFWKEQLAGAPLVLELPADFKRPPVQNFRGKTLRFLIETEPYTRLKELVKAEGTTLYVLLITLFQLLLARLSGKTDFICGTAAAARTKREYTNAVGYYINMLALRFRLQEGLSFRELLKRNKNLVLKALNNQDLPFPVLVEQLAPRRELSRTPVFQVIFNLLNRKLLGKVVDFLDMDPAAEPCMLGSLPVKGYRIDDQEGQFDLTLEVLDNDRSLQCALKYSTDLFQAETVAGFARAFRELLETALAEPGFIPDWPGQQQPGLTINLAGTFTLEPAESLLRFWLSKINPDSALHLAGYNQLLQELLNPASAFTANHRGYNVIWLRLEDWLLEDYKLAAARIGQARELTGQLIAALKTAVTLNPSAGYLLFFCPASPAALADEHFSSIIDECTARIHSAVAAWPAVYTIAAGELLAAYPLTGYYEALGESQGHMPYTEDFYAVLATLTIRKVYALLRPPFKVLAVDCDNTLWQGVVGEDGPTGVVITETERALQEFLIRQTGQGMLLCLCSKNNAGDVWAVFANHPQMVLKKNQLAGHRINWLAKSENIHSLAAELNLSPDSFVFIDDNPLECAEVAAGCPGVLTIHWDRQAPPCLEQSWVFDRPRVTAEDRQRTRLYREETERRSFAGAAGDFAAFIAGLEIRIEILPITEPQLTRVSQLSFRTNQFNFTTQRRTEAEISHWLEDQTCAGYAVSLSDRFGDYGLVGVILLKQAADACLVDTFLLSCRALGKGVEYRMMAHIGSHAAESGLAQVDFTLIPTARNTPAARFLEELYADYLNREGEKTVYRVPTNIVQAVVFRPEAACRPAALPAADEAAGSLPQQITTGGSLQRNRLLTEILQHYTTAAQLSAAAPPAGRQPAADHRLAATAPVSATEQILLTTWQEVLKTPHLSPTANFFDLGGHSALIPRIVIKLEKEHGIRMQIVDLFQYPTIRMLAAYLEGSNTGQDTQAARDTALKQLQILSGRQGQQAGASGSLADNPAAVAIIGLAGRFPGADDVESLWENLAAGRDCLTDFSDEELRASGVPEDLLASPQYVKRGGIITQPEYFDAAFFGYSPREAMFIDHQQRIFLECAWHALEHAGYDPERIAGITGVYAGCGINNYLLKNLLSQSAWMEQVVDFLTFIGNEKDFLSTRVSYKLNLTGPSLTIQTACSTSLVAVQQAYQALLTGQCDMALAGGISVGTPRMKGYLFTRGQILSADGYCRTFDSKASGTVFGEGVGIVVLKRLADALADRDTIHAVIRGMAINNDGCEKVGYTAPAVKGQAAVVAQAQALAGLEPEDLSYIEAHGTGTLLGDPIEVKALSSVFRQQTSATGFCALGSLKPNLGHLDVAAGITGLIKIILMLKHRQLPPSIHYNQPNPELELAESPFYITTELKDWESPGKPRIAGVSSFGIGGTNAHCILQEAPAVRAAPCRGSWHLLPLSAAAAPALEELSGKLAAALPHAGPLADIAYTLQNGRSSLPLRRTLVCNSPADGAASLQTKQRQRVCSGSPGEKEKQVILMFSGQGSQYAGMGQQLYTAEEIFRREVDGCCRILLKTTGLDLLAHLFPDRPEQSRINDTAITQPALFVIEYALARLLQHYGIRPAALIGHSIGEYTAAAVSGVFALEHALQIVAERGRLMQAQPRGSMLSVSLAAEPLSSLLPAGLCLAVINAPELAVVAGGEQQIDQFTAVLDSYAAGRQPPLRYRKLVTSHAFHSPLMQAAVAPFTEFIARFPRQQPQLPFISNVTGTWITGEQAADPAYWGSHLRNPVHFSRGLATLLQDGSKILVETGPGLTLVTLARLHLQARHDSLALATMRHAREEDDDHAILLHALGQLWCAGAPLDWQSFYPGEQRSRLPLPLYPFQREKFWIDHQTGSSRQTASPAPAQQRKKARAVKQQQAAAPRSVTEQLTAIWQDVLGLKSIGPEDNFYEIGGHSMLAAQLFAEIEEHFGKNIPLSALYKAPTITQLAAIIREEQAAGLWSCLVPVQPGGSKPPLFLVHGAEGNVLLYRSLAHYLGKDQPVYGLQAAALDGRETVEAEFTRVAASYLREIKGVQARGPYRLGGYCLGGTIALEIAQQLQAGGDEVCFLGMIEIYNIRTIKWPQPLYYRLYNDLLNIIYHLRNLLEAESATKIAFFREKLAIQLHRLKVSAGVGLARIARFMGKKQPGKFHHLRIDKEFDRALEEYDIRPYDGKINLFVSKYRFAGFNDKHFGFGQIGKQGVVVHEIPCYPRGSLVEPYVQILAEKINNCLQAAGD